MTQRSMQSAQAAQLQAEWNFPAYVSIVNTSATVSQQIGQMSSCTTTVSERAVHSHTQLFVSAMTLMQAVVEFVVICVSMAIFGLSIPHLLEC